MKVRTTVLLIFGILTSLVLTGCPNLLGDSGTGGNGGAGADVLYTLVYDGNGNEAGSAPVDGNEYEPGASVTVANAGTMSRSGYAFDGWNTSSDGSGTAFSPGSTFVMPSGTATLYAQWIPTASSGLAAPAGLTSSAANGQIVLTWEDPATASLEHIEITWSPDGESAQVVEPGTETFTATELTNGTVYTFTLVAVDTSGNTSEGTSVAGVPAQADPGAPADVTDLSVVAGSGAVTLIWTDPADDDLNQIELTWSPDGTAPQSVGAGTESYTAMGLENGTNYAFTLRTVDVEGNRSAGTTISAAPTVPDSTAPANVSSPSASVADGQVELGWTDPDESDFFQIEVTWTPGGDEPQFVSSGEEGFVASGLDNGTEYTFTIATVDAGGNRSEGKSIAATPAAVDPEAPGEVAELTATEGDGQITLAWKDPVDEDLARIDVLWKPGGEKPQSVKPGTQVFTATGLTNGEGYTFLVVTVDADGHESAGRSVTATPQTAPKGTTNLLINPTADDGANGWKVIGRAGTAKMPVSGATVFYLEDTENESAELVQAITLPEGSAGKYVLIAGQGWVAKTVEKSITRRPFLYGVERDDSGRTLNTYQGQNLRHTAAAKTWQPLVGIFEVNKGATEVVFALRQAAESGDPPDGTRATFDNLEIRLFDTSSEAKRYLEIYLEEHPERLEDDGSGGGGEEPTNLLVNPTADEKLTGWETEGSAGVDKMPVSGRSVFYTEDSEKERAALSQAVTLPKESAGKYLLVLGYGWVDDVVAGSITRHPLLKVFARDEKGSTVPLESKTLLHDADAKTWQPLGGLFQVEKGVVGIDFSLAQAAKS